MENSKKSQLSDRVYGALRRAIIEQALLPGKKLPEDTVGDQFGVSRTVVRSALERLHSEGLVEKQPNRGAAVAKPSLAEARDVFALRHCLEREVIRKLAELGDQDSLTTLEAHVCKEEDVVEPDGARSVRLAGEFHILLAALTRNQVLRRYVSETVSRCSLILAVYGRSHSSDCAVEEHRQIIEALRQGDREAATAVMDTHLGAVERRARLTVAPERDIRSILTDYAGAAE